ncbi:hypothetical protein ANN_03406 [Periplaneta americana]|uniref:Uncharacterized protein n=1 Tax=Periplaneta americana TaxID=6978 RepID=A0ABQ8U345_PERAM|nr:hypothetical protein ANN_03406 [Periplaneta americana]
MSRATTTATVEMGFQVLLRPPCSPDLVSSDYNLFGALKKPLHGLHFTDFQELKAAVLTWVRQTLKTWFQEGSRSCHIGAASVYSLIEPILRKWMYLSRHRGSG